MRPAPIPDALVVEGTRRVIVAAPDGDLLNPDIAPVEALVVGRIDDQGPRILLRLTPEGDDAERLARGESLYLVLYGNQVPVFALEVAP